MANVKGKNVRPFFGVSPLPRVYLSENMRRDLFADINLEKKYDNGEVKKNEILVKKEERKPGMVSAWKGKCRRSRRETISHFQIKMKTIRKVPSFQSIIYILRSSVYW
jgi:hypothetical protein